MPRWEHDSEGRLQKAALELFEEQGFEKTSVIEIAERAGVTTRTFFRYFSDKREVLFAGADELRAALVAKILAAPDVAEPLRVVTGVLAGFDWQSVGPREGQRRRQAVIEANPELLERDLIKHHGVTVGLTDALRRRGVEEDIARLAVRVGIQTFFTAYGYWLEADDKTDLAAIVERVMALLATIAPASAAPGPSGPKSAGVRANHAERSPSRGRRSRDPEAAIEGPIAGRPR